MKLDYSQLKKHHSSEFIKTYLLVALTSILVFLLLIASATTRVTTTIQLLLPVLITAYLGWGLWHEATAQNKQNKAIAHFASVNNLRPALVGQMELALPKVLSGVGVNHKYGQGYYFKLDTENEVLIFQYQYDVKLGRATRTKRLTIATFMTKKSFPNLFLDGKSNGKSLSYKTGQKIELEGDFNQFFDLYVPKNQHIDALSIISPDVMRTLIDSGRPYDIEINNYQVTLLAENSQYTQLLLPPLIAFTNNLSKEISHKEVSWKSLPIKKMLSAKLQRNNYEGMLNIAVIALVLLYMLITIL